ALRLYATSAATREDQAQAVKTLEGAKDKIATDTAAHLALVNLYLRKGDTAAATRTRGSIADFGPVAPEGRASRALDYVSVGRRDDAKRVLREAVQSDPTAPATTRLLAAFMISDNNSDEALKLLESVLAKDPTDLDALTARGEARLLKKQHAEA